MLAAIAAGTVFSIVSSAAMVSAYQLKSVMVSSFRAPGPAGTVALTKTGTGALTLRYSIVGLQPNGRYRIAFNDRKCRAHTHGTDFAKALLRANSNGASFANTTFDDESTLQAKSVRLFRNGAQVDCAVAGYYDLAGNVDSADYLTIIHKTSVAGIVDVHATRDPTLDVVTITFSGLVPGASYVLRASVAPCGSLHHAADTIKAWSWGVSQTVDHSYHATVTHDNDFDNWASSRLFKGTQEIACGANHTSYAN